MMISKPTAVIFDFDNTLIDVWPIMVGALKTTLKKFGFTDFTEDEIKLMMHKSLRDYFPGLFGDKYDEASKFFINRYIELSSSIKALPGAENVLKLLQEKEIPIIIISNKRGQLLKKEINEFFFWDKYFSLILGSGDTKYDKPSPDPVIYATNFLNIPLDKNIWFVGDTYSDIKCAIDSGCFPVLFGLGSENKFDDVYKPEIHFKNHLETIKVLEDLL